MVLKGVDAFVEFLPVGLDVEDALELPKIPKTERAIVAPGDDVVHVLANGDIGEGVCVSNDALDLHICGQPTHCSLSRKIVGTCSHGRSSQSRNASGPAPC